MQVKGSHTLTHTHIYTHTHYTYKYTNTNTHTYTHTHITMADGSPRMFPCIYVHIFFNVFHFCKCLYP